MSAKLLILPEALADMERASEWYASKSVSLGENFLSVLESSLDRILAFPGSTPIYHKRMRRALLGKFPFGVFYRAEGDIVKVLAVFHLRQDPDKLHVRTHWISAPS